MLSGPNWLYSAVHLAGASLIGAVYVAGLVVTLRRWHVGMAPRLGGIGFGLVLLGMVGQQVFAVFLSLFGAVGGSGATEAEAMFLRLAVVSAVTVLLSAAGHLLIVLALRTALRDFERSRNAVPGGWGDAASSEGVGPR